MWKELHWKLCKKLEFHHIDKWYIYKPEGKVKDSKKQDNYLEFTRKLKKPWNIRLTAILVVVWALG